MKHARLLLAASLFFAWSLSAQTLHTNSELLDSAFRLAVWTVDHNTHEGILAAGAGYGGEWTRDAAINCWNGVSLLRPEVAQQSLWNVTEDGTRIGHQYWDKILWAIAAWHHFEVTADTAFLRRAYACSKATLAELESQHFDPYYGLFMGPAVFQDGIEAYPEPIYDPGKWDQGFVLRHHYADSICCLSTNVVYYDAYGALLRMARVLEQDTALFAARQAALGASILKHLYDGPNGRTLPRYRFDYFVYRIGRARHNAQYQEGLGASLALMSGLLSREEALQVLLQLKLTTFGIPSVSPSFPRNSREKPGRHNMMIWPHINAFYASACGTIGADDEFYRELENIATLAVVNGQGCFYEIYTIEGKPSGGWQCRSLWDKKEHQTWCATGYLRLWLDHIFGLRFDGGDHLRLAPMGMRDGSMCVLDSIRWRDTELTLIVRGRGPVMRTRINGKAAEAPAIGNIGGHATIEIELSED